MIWKDRYYTREVGKSRHRRAERSSLDVSSRDVKNAMFKLEIRKFDTHVSSKSIRVQLMEIFEISIS